MIPGDIAAALGLRASGTWRPGPPGRYATSLPFELADAAGQEPGEVAAGLAARLRGVGWIGDASVTGGGYLTVTVTPEALAALAVRIPAAGAACAASDALCGTEATAPAADRLAGAPGWDEARRQVAAEVTGRLAAAAGATIKIQNDFERTLGAAGPVAAGVAGESAERIPGAAGPVAAGVAGESGERTGGAAGPVAAGVAEAVAFAGVDAVRYGLVRTAPGRPGIDARGSVRNDLDNPFFAVRYGYAAAASVLRWAADLGVDRGPPESFRAGLLDHPGELGLLAALSWLPERVASAARRRRPDAFARYLEDLAGAWLDCRERRPALPFGGRAAPRGGAETAARLWLAAAARTALGAGLGLLGVAAPERL